MRRSRSIPLTASRTSCNLTGLILLMAGRADEERVGALWERVGEKPLGRGDLVEPDPVHDPNIILDFGVKINLAKPSYIVCLLRRHHFDAPGPS